MPDTPVVPTDPEDAERARLIAAIVASPTYRLAESDPDFLDSPVARPARLLLELLRPETYLHDHGIESTVVVFGSARILPPAAARARLAKLTARAAAGESLEPELHSARQALRHAAWYDEARALGRTLSGAATRNGCREFIVVTGGGPGIMEAANRGAHEAGACTIGLNISLPREQLPNPYITPQLAFRFHYFAMRKMHFMLRAKALVAFPGGFGTLDELFEALTLVQTGKIAPIPILLVGTDYWRRAIDLDFLVEEGLIDAADRSLVTRVDSGAAAARVILDFYRARGDPAPA
jgi:uncharacterized protein (TIGR00730 family)